MKPDKRQCIRAPHVPLAPSAIQATPDEALRTISGFLESPDDIALAITCRDVLEATAAELIWPECTVLDGPPSLPVLGQASRVTNSWRFDRFPELPPLTVLKFNVSFNKPIPPGMLHQSLEELQFGHFFNQYLGPGVLPPGLTMLEFRTEIHKYDNRKGFDQPLANVLPRSLTSLKLGQSFNRIIHHEELPTTLTFLKFGWSFNRPFQRRVLPKSLTELHFGSEFNQPLPPGMLPQGLVNLGLGDRFAQPLPLDVLPPSLTALKHEGKIPGLEVGTLPASLTRLQLGHHQCPPLTAGVLPASLTYLDLGGRFNRNLPPGVLPPSLATLKFGSAYNEELQRDALPFSLKRLQFGRHYNHSFADGVLPAQLEELQLGYHYQWPLDDALPPSLLKLTLAREIEGQLIDPHEGLDVVIDDE